jgi:hypothetical protein
LNEVKFLRTPVNIALVFFEQYLEANRRIAAAQMGSPLRSVFKFMFKIPSSRSCEFGIQRLWAI